MRQKLTPAFVRDAGLPEAGDRVVYWDTATPGFGLAVMKGGARRYVYQYRNALQQSRRMTWAARVEKTDTGLTLDEARREAKKVAGDVERGIDPVETARAERRAAEERTPQGGSRSDHDVQGYLRRLPDPRRRDDTRRGRQCDVRGETQTPLRPERLAVFERLVYPENLSGRQIEEIKRSEISELLDKVEDERGPLLHSSCSRLCRKCSVGTPHGMTISGRLSCEAWGG
jgi:hypothetical protein